MNKNKIMPLVKIREEIFKLLFEYELMKNEILNNAEEFIKNNENNLNKSKTDFFMNYINGYIENEEKIIDLVIQNLQGWTYERLGFVEKVILKMSFYEIAIKDEAHEIAINEALQLLDIYSDEKTKKFINGILACLVKGK